jgi:long-subunit acyl-CoA synthetase (AMP-forming)
MVAGQPDGVRQAMEEAFRLGRERVRAGQLGTVPAEIAAGCASAEESTFRPLRERLGLDQARIVLSGAAAIPVDVVEFFNALGVPLTDGWGMSELTCMAAITPVGELRLGTVGRAIRGVEIVLADDGELLVRGPTVMRGYLGRPDLTAEAIDPEGWMHTGDIGEIDADGYIRVIDRKKELIINSSGKNMSPANIEGAVKACSSMIAQVVAIGDDRPFNVALVVLDPDAAAQFAEARGRASDAASLAADADVLALVQDAVDRANARLSRVEQIKRFMVLPTFWEPGSDILTHTMKLRRRPIAARYAREIEQLYAGVEPRPLTTAG